MARRAAATSPWASARVRGTVFATLCLFALSLGVLGLWLAASGRQGAPAGDSVAIGSEALSAVESDEPSMLFVNTSIADGYGKLGTVAVSDPDGARGIADLECERVDYQAGRGVCLRSNRGVVTTYEAILFDEHFTQVAELGLAGPPSRTRVSPSGRLAAATVFVTGHSYVADFSTQTTILDLDTQEVIADLEVDFTVNREGKAWRSVDFNFWGVTFEDDETFYATLGTGGEHYLVRGNMSDRRMEVVRDGVECPSLSPDGTRIAFKMRSDPGLGPTTWRIGVLDLSTLDTTVLAETRNVDDQVYWADESTIMYGLPNPSSPAEADTWSVPADGTGTPRLLVSKAWSSVVVNG